MSKNKLNLLYVYMNDKHVGILKREFNNLIFTYNEEWLNLESARPISLSMPLTEVPYKGNLVENYFDNLLPDSETIRKRIQSRFGISSKNCFDLLSYIGRDCVGALQLLTYPQESDNKKILSYPLQKSEIAKILKNYQNAPLGMRPESDFRISIAGAQEKTALLWYQQQWHSPQGPTPTSHIIKLPIGHIKHAGIDLSNSIENEWLCLKILSAFDLPVNEAQIEYFENMKTLVIERFDRRWSKDKQWLMRLPQEDMCQALGISSALKYESDGGPGIQEIMQILLGSKEAMDDRNKFMKAVFLFWVMGAIDGHAKNFSISLEAQGRYQMTPLYDILSAYPIAAKRQLEWHDLKMAMSLKGKNRHYHWYNILPRHWLQMSDQCQFSSALMQNIMDEVFDNMENVISRVTELIPKHFPGQISDAIFSGMRQVKDRCNPNPKL